jgi:hypothetical protein
MQSAPAHQANIGEWTVMKKLSARLLTGSVALIAMLGAGASLVRAQDLQMQWVARLSSYKGNTRCSYGDSDCNRCANNVRSRFSAMKNAGGNDYEYNYDRLGSYPPALKHPQNDFSTGPAGGKHLQSFNRLGIEDADGRAWFAGTYGSLQADDATMFLVSAPVSSTGAVNGNGRLQYMYAAWDRHPGGSQGVGKYLLIGHDELDLGRGGYLEVYNLTDKQHGTRKRVPSHGNVRIAAVGAAKLAGGGLLVMAKRAGDDNLVFDIHYAQTVTNGLPGWEYITSVQGVQQVENMSLITECGTSDIYVLTGQGSDSGVGTNYWKLYLLRQTKGYPELLLVDSANKNQDSDCDARAAATAYVSKDGNLAFYCAQKLALDPVAAALCASGVPFTCEAAFGTVDDNMTFRQYW